MLRKKLVISLRTHKIRLITHTMKRLMKVCSLQMTWSRRKMSRYERGYRTWRRRCWSRGTRSCVYGPPWRTCCGGWTSWRGRGPSPPPPSRTGHSGVSILNIHAVGSQTDIYLWDTFRFRRLAHINFILNEWELSISNFHSKMTKTEFFPNVSKMAALKMAVVFH